MSDQKGNVFVISLVIIAVAIVVGLLVGGSSTNPVVDRLLKPLRSLETTQQLSTSSALLQTPTTVPTIQTTIKQDDQKITASGEYVLNANQKINWNLVLPKYGGAVTGNVNGVCNGSLVGTMGKPDAQGQASLTGAVNGECSLIPGLPFKTTLKANFDGMFKTDQQVADVNYSLTSPVSTRGTFSLPLKP